MVERNMCNAVMRGTVIPPGLRAHHAQKGSRRKHVRDAGPDKRVTGAGAHTASSKGKEEGEVHLAPPPHQH
jgi:hypothetical protein